MSQSTDSLCYSQDTEVLSTGSDAASVMSSVTFNEENAEEECAVCYETVDKHKNNCKTPCGHAFCFGCIVKVILQKNACPYCRAPLYQEPPRVVHEISGFTTSWNEEVVELEEGEIPEDEDGVDLNDAYFERRGMFRPNYQDTMRPVNNQENIQPLPLSVNLYEEGSMGVVVPDTADIENSISGDTMQLREEPAFSPLNLNMVYDADTEGSHGEDTSHVLSTHDINMLTILSTYGYGTAQDIDGTMSKDHDDSFLYSMEDFPRR